MLHLYKSLCVYYNLTISLNVHIAGIYVQFSQNQYVAVESDGHAILKVTLNANYHRHFPISVNLKIFVSSKFRPRAGK